MCTDARFCCYERCAHCFGPTRQSACSYNTMAYGFATCLTWTFKGPVSRCAFAADPRPSSPHKPSTVRTVQWAGKTELRSRRLGLCFLSGVNCVYKPL